MRFQALMGKRAFLTLIVLLLIVAGLLPVVSMLARSVFVDGHFTLESYRGLLASERQWMLMKNSLVLSILVTILALAFGTPLGVLLGKTDLPLRRLLTVIFVIPLLIPPYIIAVSWFYLLGREGLLSQLLGASVSATFSDLLFGLPGCVLVLFSVFLPIPMLLTMVFLRTVNPRLEEAGRLVSSWRGVLTGITLPIILPGVLLSAILVFLLTFGEFSVPNFLRYDVFPVESFTQFSAFYNFKSATAVAVPLAIVPLIFLLAEAKFLREKTYQLHPFPESERLPLIELGAWRKWLFVPVAIAAFVIVVAPIAVLIIRSASLDAYAEAFSRAGDSLLRSLEYACIGATLMSFVGFFTGYLIHTRALKLWRFVDSLTIFLFALPSTVIGIGLISLWNTPSTNFIYATPAIIIIG